MPPIRPPRIDSPPPPLRPAAADATIPLAPPEPELLSATPIPDEHRDAPLTTRPPRRNTPAPSLRIDVPPAEDTASDAPVPDGSGPTVPQTEPATGGLRSDEDLFDDDLDFMADSVSPEPIPTPEAIAEPAPTATPWWASWMATPPPPENGRVGSRLSRHLSYEVIVVIVTFLVASVLLFTSFDGEMRDVYVKSREILGAYPAHTSGEVALVTIGEEALYLWNPGVRPPEITPRAMLGELVAVLDEAGAEVIVLDFLLDTPEPGDERLAESAKAHGNVIAAERFVLTDPATGGRFAAGASTTLGDGITTGFANLGEEALWTSADERLVRSAHLVEVIDRARLQGDWPASVGQDQAQDELTPHMTLLAAWQMRHPESRPDALMAQLAQSCTVMPVHCELTLTDLGLADGPDLHSRFAVNFRGPEHADGLPTVRASELLRISAEPAMYRMAGVDRPLQIPEHIREAVGGKLVVIGRVDDTATDRFATPFGFPVPVRPDMDGARIQAQLIDTLLTGRHAHRTPAWSMWVFAGVLTIPLVLTARSLREDIHTLAWILAGVALVVMGAVIFSVTDGYVVDLSVPLTVLLMSIVFLRLRGWAID